MIYSKIEEAVFFKNADRVKEALKDPDLKKPDARKAWKVAKERNYTEILIVFERWINE